MTCSAAPGAPRVPAASFATVSCTNGFEREVNAKGGQRDRQGAQRLLDAQEPWSDLLDRLSQAPASETAGRELGRFYVAAVITPPVESSPATVGNAPRWLAQQPTAHTDAHGPSSLSAVLSVHHATMHTFAQTGALKIIENHLGRAYIKIG